MMAEIKGLIDDNGIIYECNKILPEEYKIKLLEVLAEIEDNECHKNQSFPKSKLHKVVGAKKYIELILTKYLDGDYIFNMVKIKKFIYVRF